LHGAGAVRALVLPRAPSVRRNDDTPPLGTYSFACSSWFGRIQRRRAVV